MTNRKFDINLFAAQGLGAHPYKTNEKIFSSGDQGNCMYLVVSGAVEITNFGTLLDNVTPGDIFGEMAVIDGAPRSATATAKEPTEVVAIDKDAFRKLTKEEPDFALEIMRCLVERLRRMNHSQIYFK